MRPVANYPGYEVTEDGQVWSKHTKRWLRAGKISRGYLLVCLSHKGKEKSFLVHRLILAAFVGPCPKGMQSCHNNGIRTDNRLENLRWGTPAENQADRIRHNTAMRGCQCPAAKISDRDARFAVYAVRTGLVLQKEIAEMLGVGATVISGIINRKRWKHIWTS